MQRTGGVAQAKAVAALYSDCRNPLADAIGIVRRLQSDRRRRQLCGE